MAINLKILTPITLPSEVEVEIEDTIRGETVVKTIELDQCFSDLKEIGLNISDFDQLSSLLEALVKHHVTDEYLMSIGIDPHQNKE